jgi:hypothetical protein
LHSHGYILLEKKMPLLPRYAQRQIVRKAKVLKIKSAGLDLLD